MQINGINYIDLDGPDGNAFAIGGIAVAWARQLGLPVPNITDGADSYEQVLDRFDQLFKDRVTYKFLADPREEAGNDDTD